MEGSLFYSVSLSIIFLILAVKIFSATGSQRKNVPPSPPCLPILGHLHLLKQPVHRSLQRISQKYGPVAFLRFGSRLVVLVSSSSAAEECFKTNDICLANRPRLLIGKYLGYEYSTLVGAQYGDHWRNLRRICTLDIFSQSRLSMFMSSRQDEITILLNKLFRVSSSSHGFVKVELRPNFIELTYNILLRMVAGKRYYGADIEVAEEARNFRDIIEEILRHASASNPVDFLPFLRWFDYKGYMKRLKRLSRDTDKLLQSLIDEQRSDGRDDLENRNSMINHLITLQASQPEYYTDEIIKGLILVIATAGTDTTATTLEWAMSNLLNHPEVLKKAREEVDREVGQHRLVNESDLPKLHYLQNIISETLRLYPPTPLLLPHMSSDKCTIGGYVVPPDTMVLVNAWAIHKDPELWEDPTSFKPERFESGENESYKLLPFGLGRRACPGSGLANRVLGCVLGSLIQCFEWERVGEELIDMTEGEGLTMPRAQPLVAQCKATELATRVLTPS
ncbi:hypothetical protein K2173_014849 [Erythroxylum novogranatense]|uniref:Cytochrome P450 n=1 Tax=Erythroxylum novogranatense TaxID=1862640 RepID=A0AAV8TFR6_9ROSI|nr:hypothetical protein K2173_014849 [Erythroxylum novogranatense]